MTINKFFVPESEAKEKGLGEISMPRLGQIVAIAGRNGSGKTRLLDLVERHVTFVHNRKSGLANDRINLRACEQNLVANPGAPDAVFWQEQMEQLKITVDWLTERVYSETMAGLRAVRFVPKVLLLDDPLSLNPDTLIDRYKNTKNAQSNNYHSHCLAYIQQAQNIWHNCTHQNYSGDPDEAREFVESYFRLNKIVEDLLDVQVTRGAHGDAQIFGRPIARADLSDGQKILIQLAVLLHEQQANLHESVILLDELENHLHPAAVIDVLQRIRDAAPSSQVWIATHSVSLLSYILSVDRNALWFMEEGRVAHHGKRPERVLESLLGGEARVQQLHDFTGLPRQMATLNYAAECLLPPQTVASGQRDAQVSQIRKLISDLKSDGPLRMLDFGAGKSP